MPPTDGSTTPASDSTDITPGVDVGPAGPVDSGAVTDIPDGDDESGLDLSFGEANEPAGSGAGDKTAPTAPTSTPTETPAAQPAQDPKAPAPAATPEGGQPADGQQAAPQGDAASDQPLSVQSLVDQIEAGKTQLIGALAEHRFKLSEAEVQEIETGETAAVIPKLLAKSYLDAVQSSVAMIQQIVPNLVQGILEGRRASEERQNEFFKAYPAFKGKDAELIQIARQLRALNPTMPPEQFMPELASYASVKLGIPLTAQQPRQNGGPHQPVVSSVPAFSPAAPAQQVGEFDGLVFGADEE